jgi:dihydroxyacetone kinase-like predicted kinase
MEYLSVDRPKIKLINSPDYTLEYHSLVVIFPAEQKIIAVVNNRNMADILRTVALEMVHHMQNLDNRLTPNQVKMVHQMKTKQIHLLCYNEKIWKRKRAHL